MDLGAAVDRLYGLPRERFIAERDKLAKAEPGIAERVRKLRKPTVAAWQANQLARKHPKDVAALVDLGKKMRGAQETLNGPELRELSRRRNEVLDKLVGRVSDANPGLRDLLERSYTDPAAAEDLLAGRVVTAPEGGGWGFDAAMPMPGAEVPKRDTKRDKERQRAYDEAEAAEAEAQRALEAAEEELRSRTEEVDRLQAELADARSARDDADAAVGQARREAQRRAKALREAAQRLRGS
ncbi:hypothetical protein [Kutzneria kofuensis]|uniref:Skp family chaperone for outer membrane proteins n=1 Tax=Kutzneria kofuensis TaxID=103725 RepID=A0A7W9KSK2_9PSEU|nr:hypothetical protein [Kutzneria kofuensis]MBB5897154.1 Skp family chaperone for outer membrane proteins [Kutzneria kofuensis]